MKKEDAPRLKKYLNKVLKAKYADQMTGGEMVDIVKDWMWLMECADKLESKEMKALGPSIPLPPEKKKKVKK